MIIQYLIQLVNMNVYNNLANNIKKFQIIILKNKQKK